MDLGPEASFGKLPAQVSLGGESYYLVRGKKGYQLLSTFCPHQGGEIKDQGKFFLCPEHAWRFEHTEGVCVNGPNARMFAYPVAVRAGRLIAEMPPAQVAPAAKESSR
jgi:nitrite reductase/ring-hydroxylating ferredoxin subunit